MVKAEVDSGFADAGLSCNPCLISKVPHRCTWIYWRFSSVSIEWIRVGPAVSSHGSLQLNSIDRRFFCRSVVLGWLRWSKQISEAIQNANHAINMYNSVTYYVYCHTGLIVWRPLAFLLVSRSFVTLIILESKGKAPSDLSLELL